MKETKERGITLIALIITVIVMLILAGVAINLTIGDNGIFRKSDEGALIYKNAANNESTELSNAEREMEDLINQYHGENGGGTTDNPSQTTEPSPTPTPTIPAEKPGKPNENGIYTENSTINGGEGNAFNPEIPKGFKPVDVDDTGWGDGSNPPTQETIQKGLVIQDGEGNQFVWIAVDGEKVKLNRYTFGNNGAETAQGDAVINTWQELTSSNKGNTVAKDINAFKTSVATHGGYYIARYEASYGTDGKPNSRVSTGTPSATNGVEPTQEGQLWNNVTQPNAASACRKMYDSSYGITSDLVNSYAWDTAIVFIQKYSGATSYSKQTSLNTTLANTGVNRDERCHIHDMASNCYEWTTETSSMTNSGTNYPCVNRGGANNSNTSAPGTRYNGWVPGLDKNASFRPILYF